MNNCVCTRVEGGVVSTCYVQQCPFSKTACLSIMRSPHQEEYIADEQKATFASLNKDFVSELCEDPLERKKLR